MGLDPISIIAGIATGFAGDVLKHYAQALDKTLVGKGLKAIGLLETTRDDHLREILAESLKLYLQTHPDYDLSGVENFFRDPVIIQQIGNYILDQHPLDQLAIEEALTRHIKNDAVTITLMQRHNAVPEHMLPDFLNCYRQVLNRNVDASEQAVLLAVLDATDRIMAEMRASEARIQTLISETAQQQMQILQGHPISLAPNQSIGRYRIQKTLAKGTYGTLYRAEQTDTGKIVTLKVIRLPKNLSLHDDAFSLGDTLLDLQHPAILPTLEVQLTATPPYIVSAHAKGNTLRQRIEQYAPHALPLNEAIHIITQIGQALAYLHQRHIVHRGVQPSCILFDEQFLPDAEASSDATARDGLRSTPLNAYHDQPLLTGFDLAIDPRFLSHQSLEYPVGPLNYMPPEQHRGVISAKSDQYALGCIAYELCTGRLPFSEAPLSSPSSQQPKPPIAPHLINPNVPPQIEHAILKALSIKLDQRYDNVNAFLAAFTKS